MTTDERAAPAAGRMMNLLDVVAALRFLPDDAELHVSVRKADLVKALEQRTGGPSIMTTGQAARLHGYTADRWRSWAAEGLIAGAYQDVEDGPWHLPRTSVEEHIRQHSQRGATRQRAAAKVVPITGSQPRGPWKARASDSHSERAKPKARATRASAE